MTRGILLVVVIIVRMNKNMTDMGKGSQKESNTNDNKFMKMVEATSNAYSEALKKLAEGELNDR